MTDAKSTTIQEQLECGTSLAEREHLSCDEGLPELLMRSSSSSTTENDSQLLFSKEQTLRDDSEGQSSSPGSVSSLRSWIALDVLTSVVFASPFAKGGLGSRDYFQLPLVYCDQTASNRPLQSLESYLHQVCLPLYGNTHTNTSITGSQSTAFVAEARQIVAEEANAKITGKASLDVVLFAGNGATSAVELLIDCLGLKHACIRTSDTNLQQQRPVVFVGPYEHHSNLIPWRESGCEIVMIPECPASMQVDLVKLEWHLQRPGYENRLKMGTFTAASNVTGKVCDVKAIAACLHRHGALAFFDYATAAPYMSVDMNPPPDSQYPSPQLIAKDAVFLSPHKMLGGVGTPGVLIVKKHLVSQSNPPSRSGGGTVFYVSHSHHRFLSNRMERYEGGTPNVSGIIRVGLTFLMKRKAQEKYARLVADSISNGHSTVPIPPRSIEEYDYQTYEHVSRFLREQAPNLVLLSSNDDDGCQKKLPIFSFLIRWGKRFLHYNYVCAVLNDVFGIQSRGGCQCSGPYSQRLLGLTDINNDGDEVPNQRNMEIETALVNFKERAELLRPGYTRISLPFKGLMEEEAEYVKKALVWVAEHAWELMCQYRCNHRTGEWRHMSRQGRPLGRSERRWLGYYDFESPKQRAGQFLARGSSLNIGEVLDQAFSNANTILAAAREDRSSIIQTLKLSDAEAILGDDAKLEELRWYVYPQECALVLSQGVFSAPVEDLVGALSPLFSGAAVGGADALLRAAESSSGRGEDGPESPINPLPMSCHISRSSTAPKKATRDSATWGTGQAVGTLEVTAANGSASTADGGGAAVVLHAVPNARRKPCHVKPPQKLMKQVIQAVYQWDMLKDGDRLLLGLSGGKDSLSLLHVLLEIKRRLPFRFDLEVCTIDPMTPSFDPSPLIPYVESLGLTYHYIRDNIVSRAVTAGKGGQEVSSLCSFCARMKRGKLYACARENKCNKLVLAQHLDDCAESFMMSVMHNGFLRTMQANYTINAGDLSVIRPLVYCRERLMTDFAKAANLPVINENCPACFEEPKERARVKKLLSREETLYPNFFDNIRRSLIPLMHADSTAILRCYLDEIVAKTKGDIHKKRKRNGDDECQEIADVPTTDSTLTDARQNLSLQEASDEELLRELARRKADKYRLAGANKFLLEVDGGADADTEPSGPVCAESHGNGVVACCRVTD